MKAPPSSRRIRIPAALCVVSALWSLALPSSGQLAITEVMSSATTNLGSAYVPQHSDFWELTNLGTNRVDLDDYLFADDGGVATASQNAGLFSGKHLEPGESMVLAKYVIGSDFTLQTPEQFRSWWGDANLPANLQIYFYRDPGFSKDHDSVMLFHVSGTVTSLVDRVDFLKARTGSTFAANPDTGAFDLVSIAGQYGAFKAVETDDIGSPGFSTGVVPLAITTQPQNVTVDAGSAATFTVGYRGLPQPHLQWRANGVPIPGATAKTLTISPALPTNAVNYSVELDNGLARIVSSNAVLLVNTNPTCARITTSPSDLVVFTGQTAIFRAVVGGYPYPAIQWQFNGTNIPGASSAILTVPNATNGSQGSYTIRVTNGLCTNTATARLTVTRRPLLGVTEVLAHCSDNVIMGEHGDFWELTSYDTNAVNLRGYRFNDYPGPSLEGTFDILDDLVIRPGESIIFARGMSAQAFKDWWGEENLPEDIQIITYTSQNFSPEGDAIYLWNAASIDPDDHVVKAEFVDLTYGVTLEFGPGLSEFGVESTPGVRGAIVAVEADDIGSPGYVTNHPPRVYQPRCRAIERTEAGTNLRWTVRSGRRYELQYRNVLGNGGWTALGQYSPTNLSLTVSDPSPPAAQRFYRMQVLPDSP